MGSSWGGKRVEMRTGWKRWWCSEYVSGAGVVTVGVNFCPAFLDDGCRAALFGYWERRRFCIALASGASDEMGLIGFFLLLSLFRRLLRG